MLKIVSNQNFAKSLLLVSFLLISFVCSSQSTEAEKEIYTFKEVETPPLAKRCKAKWETERQKKCTTAYIQNHLMRNFDTGLGSDLGEGIVSMKIHFVIDEEGKVSDVSVTGGPKIINEHAIEVASSLPPFQPGIHEGKPVRVQMEMPLRFKITR